VKFGIEAYMYCERFCARTGPTGEWVSIAVPRFKNFVKLQYLSLIGKNVHTSRCNVVCKIHGGMPKIDLIGQWRRELQPVKFQ